MIQLHCILGYFFIYQPIVQLKKWKPDELNVQWAPILCKVLCYPQCRSHHFMGVQAPKPEISIFPPSQLEALSPGESFFQLSGLYHFCSIVLSPPSFLSFSYFFLLRRNSYTIKLTILKCTYNSVTFSTFPMLYNHPPPLSSTKTFLSLQKFPKGNFIPIK